MSEPTPRDVVAAIAMHALLGMRPPAATAPDDNTRRVIAREAYAMADAMALAALAHERFTPPA